MPPTILPDFVAKTPTILPDFAAKTRSLEEKPVHQGEPAVKVHEPDDKKRKCFLENINNVVNEFGAYGAVADPLLRKWFDFMCKQRANLPPEQA